MKNYRPTVTPTVTTQAQLHKALEDVMALVDRYGLGDDDNETEPVVAAARAALTRADWDKAQSPAFAAAVARVRRQQGA